MAAQNEPRNGGIINPLFDGLTYNTRGHFALAKYPRVLYVKPSNKVYLLFDYDVILPFKAKRTRKIYMRY